MKISKTHHRTKQGIVKRNPGKRAVKSKFHDLDKALKKSGQEFYSVVHAKDYPDGAKTFIIERTQVARLVAKNKEHAKKQVKKAFGTGVLEVRKITDPKEIIELKEMMLKEGEGR